MCKEHTKKLNYLGKMVGGKKTHTEFLVLVRSLFLRAFHSEVVIILPVSSFFKKNSFLL